MPSDNFHLNFKERRFRQICDEQDRAVRELAAASVPLYNTCVPVV